MRHVFKGKQGSYYLVNEGSKITISNNTIFSVSSQSEVYNEQYQQICYFHFYSIKGNLDKLIKEEKLDYQIIILDNIYTAPIHIVIFFLITAPGWLGLLSIHPNPVMFSYNKIVKRTLKGIDRKDIGIIPSSICQCVNSTEYNCVSTVSHELGAIYPGQTISTRLIIPRLVSIPQTSISLTVVNKNLP